MREITVRKVTVNIGVGESGEKLQKAEKLLAELTGQKAARGFSKATHPEFGVKKHAPIGAKVTLRKNLATDFLKKALEAVENKVKRKQYDAQGNLSFGIHEYIEMPGAKYDPDIGMFGMDVSVNLARPGYGISKRKMRPCKIPAESRISKEEAIDFFKKNFGVETE
jgi:large subunit ribosomal protein L5|tara:strand:+ start:1636 stop:2133 length:498 start_codon:yes stop_codon:yes gene_type:complete